MDASYPDSPLFIGGEWLSRDGMPVVNPATGKAVGTVSLATRDELDAAVAAAARGLAVWRDMPPGRRSDIMRDAANLIRARSEEIARNLTIEQGKPLAQARWEVLRSGDLLDWDAEEGRRLYGRVIPAEAGMRHMVLRQPIGVVAGFSPWNFPATSPMRKIAGALGAGCAIVIKASEETPATACAVARAFQDAGLPDGVLNLVFGDPTVVSSHLIVHPAVRMITFTGSVPVGKHLAQMASGSMKPALMELGGHAPVIVCEDADARAVAMAAVTRKLQNAGQICVSPTRFIVHESQFKVFADTFAEHAAKVVVGDGLDPATQMGPLINERRRCAVLELIDDAARHGADIATGGKPLPGEGFFMPITTLVGPSRDSRIMNEEPFGPAVPIVSFRDLDDAIGLANSVPYGLAGFAFTESADSVGRLSDRLEVGNLAINHFAAMVAETPFGGVKESGYGREGGSEGIQNFSIVKNVSHQYLRK